MTTRLEKDPREPPDRITGHKIALQARKLSKPSLLGGASGAHKASLIHGTDNAVAWVERQKQATQDALDNFRALRQREQGSSE